MMNKSKIDWCDFTWNPVTGCTRNCPYCYARKQARRFCGDIRLNGASDQLKKVGDHAYILECPFKSEYNTTIPFPVGFLPTFHRYRLPMPAEKKKPANIFVCSMADLFAPDVPTEWILEVLDAAQAAPWHNYLFLTKCPERYAQLDAVALLPREKNFWYGTTVTKQAELYRVDHLPKEAHRFVSIEPITEAIGSGWDTVDWLIVGAETGNQKTKTAPDPEWLNPMIEWAGICNIPVLMKDSAELRAVWGGPLIQQFPPELQHQEEIIPHCEECEAHAKILRHHNSVRGDVYTHVCHEAIDTHKKIPGRYARTSPPWCPKRGNAGESKKEEPKDGI